MLLATPMLGTLQAGPVWHRVLGVGVVVAMLAVWTRLQSVALRLKERELESRWASTLRDLLNLLLVVTLWTGFWLTGLPGPAAFLFAGTLGIAIDVIRHAAPDVARRNRLTLFAVLPAGLVIALFPGPALDAAARLVDGVLRY